jgi:hypothetical protein
MSCKKCNPTFPTDVCIVCKKSKSLLEYVYLGVEYSELHLFSDTTYSTHGYVRIEDFVKSFDDVSDNQTINDIITDIKIVMDIGSENIQHLRCSRIFTREELKIYMLQHKTYGKICKYLDIEPHVIQPILVEYLRVVKSLKTRDSLGLGYYCKKYKSAKIHEIKDIMYDLLVEIVEKYMNIDTESSKLTIYLCYQIYCHYCDKYKPIDMDYDDKIQLMLDIETVFLDSRVSPNYFDCCTDSLQKIGECGHNVCNFCKNTVTFCPCKS